MTVRFVRKSDGKSFDSGFCERQLNVLAHAQAIELDIGSSCGGHGVCGGDKIQIPAEQRLFFSPVTEAEQDHLSQKQLNDGWRLACQCFPQQNGQNLILKF